MLVTEQTSSSLSVLATDDSMSDDVFEAPDSAGALGVPVPQDCQPSPTGYRDYQPPAGALRLHEQAEDEVEQMVHKVRGVPVPQDCQPSPTGYRDYHPPAGALRLHEQVEDEVEQMVHKTILLGDSGVGKTSLLVQFDTGRFQSGNFSATVGIGFTNKVVTVDGSKVKLQIWDTAGQERFRSVTHAYYRDAHALLLLYDVTSKTSFDNIRAWLGEIREYAQDDVVIMLLGNKADSGAQREVHQEEGHRLAREYNVAFMETSAKTGMNVELTFMTVARQLKCHRSDNPDDTRFSVHDYVQEQAQKGSCPPCAS